MQLLLTNKKKVEDPLGLLLPENLDAAKTLPSQKTPECIQVRPVKKKLQRKITSTRCISEMGQYLSPETTKPAKEIFHII